MSFRMDFMKKRYLFLNRTISELTEERKRLIAQIENIDYRLSRLEPQVWETLEVLNDGRNKQKDGRIIE